MCRLFGANYSAFFIWHTILEDSMYNWASARDAEISSGGLFMRKFFYRPDGSERPFAIFVVLFIFSMIGVGGVVLSSIINR